MSNFVSPEWVNQQVKSEKTIIFDCRFSLADPMAGFQVYQNDHIKGAYYADLNRDLSGPVLTHGGRHPLPSVNILSQFFSRCGVDSEKNVVAYDDQSGTMASRLWWLLKYLGHERVYVMQGGYTNYKEKGYRISRKMPADQPSHFISKVNKNMVVTMNEMLTNIENKEKRIIDAREPNRFKGLTEPIDHKAGHIPTAINIPWESHFQSPGRWKNQSELHEMYQDRLTKNVPAIVYCGSGVTACVNLLAMDEAGIKNAALYAGSWSDWISYSDNKIITEK